MNQVRGIKVTLKEILDSDPINAVNRDWVVPKKATILSNNAGTLIEAESGGLYIIPVGDWFRSVFHGKNFPQVDDFNKLQDLGFTAIKDAMFRKNSEKLDGQEVRGKNNVSVKKVDKTMASNIKSQKKH